MSVVSATLPLFLVMDPIGNIPMSLVALRDMEPQRRQPVLVRELLIALGVLIFFLVAGRYLLELFQISQPSLSVAGGVVLFIIALPMTFPSREVWVCSLADRREIPETRTEVPVENSPDAAAVRVFPPAVPLLTILIGIALNRLWPVEIGFELSAPARYWIGGTIVVSAILGLGLYSVILVRRSGQTENPWKPTTEIIDRGPFRFTRNPMYLQMVLVCIGFAVVLGNIWILVLLPLCAWALQRFAILPEEAYLERKFGERYVSYRRRVRRWL